MSAWQCWKPLDWTWASHPRLLVRALQEPAEMTQDTQGLRWLRVFMALESKIEKTSKESTRFFLELDIQRSIIQNSHRNDDTSCSVQGYSEFQWFIKTFPYASPFGGYTMLYPMFSSYPNWYTTDGIFMYNVYSPQKNSCLIEIDWVHSLWYLKFLFSKFQFLIGIPILFSKFPYPII